jgi:hypothetical protein
MVAVANVTGVSGYPDEAKKIIKPAICEIEKQKGIDHRLTLSTLRLLGLIYSRQQSHEEARQCFELSRARAHALFGDSPGDVDIDLLIGYTYTVEGNVEMAKLIFREGIEKSQGREGYEMVFARATNSLLVPHLHEWEFAQALPYVGNFLRYFSFRFFFRIFRVPILLVAAACLLGLDAVLRGNVFRVAFICAMTELWGSCCRSK